VGRNAHTPNHSKGGRHQKLLMRTNGDTSLPFLVTNILIGAVHGWSLRLLPLSGALLSLLDVFLFRIQNKLSPCVGTPKGQKNRGLGQSFIFCRLDNLLQSQQKASEHPPQIWMD